VGLRRLRAAEWLAAAAGIGLLVSLALPWYDLASGYESFTVIDILLALLAALAIALAVLQATQRVPAKPVAAGVVTVTFGVLGILLVLFRLIAEPGPDAAVDLGAGAWAGLAATIAVTAAGWWSLADEHERVPSPSPEPELRPTPAP
jgi:hypothetical protein